MGFWPDGDWRFIAFLPSELKRVLEELGFEPDTVIQEWYERGWMVTDNERKRKTKLVRIGQKIVRTYAISRVAIQELKTKKAQKPRFDDHERISFEELATVCHFFSPFCLRNCRVAAKTEKRDDENAKPGKDQNLNDQRRIIREEFLEELDAFAASPPEPKPVDA